MCVCAHSAWIAAGPSGTTGNFLSSSSLVIDLRPFPKSKKKEKSRSCKQLKRAGDNEAAISLQGSNSRSSAIKDGKPNQAAAHQIWTDKICQEKRKQQEEK